MNVELDNALVTAYPRLYRQHRGNLRETAMCWGFECGDGWYGLLEKLSRCLENEIAQLIATGMSLEEAPCASQVKEKYGTLRFYMSSETDTMTQAIEEACRASAKTCEACGQPGRVRGKGWLVCRCAKCWKQYQKKRDLS